VGDARRQVLAKIANKRKEMREARRRIALGKGPWSIVAEFIRFMETARTTAKSVLDIETALRRGQAQLYMSLQDIDPDVDVKIVWHNEDDMENWQDMIVEGVHIVWSKFYRGKHPLEQPEKYIDVGSLWLQGYFSEYDGGTEKKVAT